MAIAFRSQTNTTYAARTSTVLTPPAGLANGDILVAVIFVGDGSAPTAPTPPAGWAAFGTPTAVGAGGFFGNLSIFWKRAASESGSYTFSHAPSYTTQGLLKAYSGCLASGTPLGATSNSTGTGSSTTATGITTTAANSFLLFEAHNWTGSGALSPPTGMTERLDILVYSADQLIAAAGATGTRTQSNGNAGPDPWAIRMVELLAEGAAAPSWVYVGRGTSVEAAVTTHTLTEPAGVAEGDLLVASIVSRVSVATSITLPAGWTRVGERLNTSISSSSTAALPSGTMAYIVRGASAPSYTFTHPIAPVPALGRVVAYRPVDQTTPFDVGGSGQTAVNVTAVSVTGITTTATNTLIVAAALGGQEAAWSGFGTTDPATNSGTTADSVLDPVSGQWLERSDIQTLSNNDTSLAIFDAVKPTAGATGNFTATASVAAGHAVIAGAFKPGAAVEPGFDVLETEGGDWRETETGVVRIIDRTSVGALNATLASSALSSAGKVLVRGTLTATLGAATLGATGKVLVAGTLTTTLGAATTSAAGKVVVRGALTATLGAATLSATGKVPIFGLLPTTTLADATVAAAGTVNDGLSPPTAESVRETEGGDWRVTENDAFFRIIDITSVGTLALVLSNATLSAAGKVTVRGSLAATLGPATLAAAGSVGGGAVPPLYDGSRETEDSNWRETEDGAIRIIDRTTVGALAATLAPATLSAGGTVSEGPPPPDQDGVRETEGGDWRETEAGTIRIIDRTTVGALAIPLASATLVAHGTVYTPVPGTSFGTLNSVLAGATLSATGTAGGGITPSTDDGYIKVWTGTAWDLKPVKVWNSASWDSRKIKVWNGAAWVDA